MSPFSSDTPECFKEGSKEWEDGQVLLFSSYLQDISAHMWPTSRCEPEAHIDDGVQVRSRNLNKGCDGFLKLVTLITSKSDCFANGFCGALNFLTLLFLPSYHSLQFFDNCFDGGERKVLP